MKRLTFSALILAVAFLSAIAAAAASTVVVHNNTSICYTIDVKAYRNQGSPISIGRERIESKKQYVFKYAALPKGTYSLFLSGDACYHGTTPTPTHVKDPRPDEVFTIEQPGQSVYIVRKP